jgi:hypothetical protein
MSILGREPMFSFVKQISSAHNFLGRKMKTFGFAWGEGPTLEVPLCFWRFLKIFYIQLNS